MKKTKFSKKLWSSCKEIAQDEIKTKEDHKTFGFQAWKSETMASPSQRVICKWNDAKNRWECDIWKGIGR